MRQSIRGYTDAVIEQAGPQGLAPLASELAAVRRVVAGSEDLQRVLVDPGVSAGARKSVLGDLFGSGVGATTMRLLSFVVDADRATDTVADIEWLVERTEAASRNMEPSGEVVLGHKSAEERVDGYATALLESLQGPEGERALGEIEDELFRFQRVVAGSGELQAALTSREIPTDKRTRLVQDLLAAKATPATTMLASYATRVGRPRDYEDLLESLVARVAAESNRRLAEVRSALDLDESQRRNLALALARAVGHDVEVRVTVDPSVVAGFVATIGDTVIDGSARHQLEILKERLVMPEARTSTDLNQRGTTTGERY